MPGLVEEMPRVLDEMPGLVEEMLDRVGRDRGSRRRDGAPRGRDRGSRGGRSALPNLLRQVVDVAELLHELELRLQPVDVLFLAHEDVREEVLGAVVAEVAARLD